MSKGKPSILLSIAILFVLLLFGVVAFLTKEFVSISAPPPERKLPPVTKKAPEETPVPAKPPVVTETVIAPEPATPPKQPKKKDTVAKKKKEADTSETGGKGGGPQTITHAGEPVEHLCLRYGPRIQSRDRYPHPVPYEADVTPDHVVFHIYEPISQEHASTPVPTP